MQLFLLLAVMAINSLHALCLATSLIGGPLDVIDVAVCLAAALMIGFASALLIVNVTSRYIGWRPLK